jgi:hypothetical protein
MNWTNLYLYTPLGTTALLLISTIQKLPQHPLSVFQPALFTGQSLEMASISGDYSASRVQVLCSSRPCRTLCQLSAQL